MTNTYPYICPSSKTLGLDFMKSELWFRNGWYWDFWWKPPAHLTHQELLPHLKWHHIWSVLLAEAQVIHKELEHFKGLLFAHVQKQDSGHKADPLTVAYLFVQQRVSFQQVKEGQLPRPKLYWKVRVGGKCPPCRGKGESGLEVRVRNPRQWPLGIAALCQPRELLGMFISEALVLSIPSLLSLLPHPPHHHVSPRFHTHDAETTILC